MEPTHSSRRLGVRMPPPMMNEGLSRGTEDDDRSLHMEVQTPENHSHHHPRDHQPYQSNVQQWRPLFYSRTTHWHNSHGHPPPPPGAYHHSDSLQYPAAPEVPSYSEAAFAPPRSEASLPRQHLYSPLPPPSLPRVTPSRDAFPDHAVASYQPQTIRPVTDFIWKAESYDVLCGRGAPTNYHPGNLAFRNLVQDHQALYLCAKRSDKPVIATNLMETVRSRGGRFLQRVKIGGGRIGWVEVVELRAYEKVCQALREGAPEFRRQMMAQSQMNASRNKENSPNTAGGGDQRHFRDDPDVNSHRRW